ncbi:NADP-dependent oxidoreductase domain-containing protein [Pavlovales sp. CCMP2436]|nr:NADP-dependent oxidoreductase domain-containing protein [Pavlovales sp. CCMP2436]
MPPPLFAVIALGLAGPPRLPTVTRRSATLAAATSAFVALPRSGIAAPLATPAPSISTSASTSTSTWTLPGNVEMPTLALNTAGLSADDSERALLLAASLRIRHVDFHPGIERDGVARALRAESGLARDLFLTTKIRKAAPNDTPAYAATAARTQISEDLAALGVDRVSMLLLRDHPSCEVMRAQWRALEEAKAAGRTRAIGVVNFCEGALRCVLEEETRPAVNYFMLHAGMGPGAHGLRSFGEERGVRTFAYGALSEPRPDPALLSCPTLRRIGAAHGRSPEEVALRWVLQIGCAVSVRPTANFALGSSMCANDAQCRSPLLKRAQLFEWSLSRAEMSELDSLRTPDGNPTLFSSAGCPGPSPLRL